MLETPAMLNACLICGTWAKHTCRAADRKSPKTPAWGNLQGGSIFRFRGFCQSISCIEFLFLAKSNQYFNFWPENMFIFGQNLYLNVILAKNNFLHLVIFAGIELMLYFLIVGRCYGGGLRATGHQAGCPFTNQYNNVCTCG